MRSRTDDAFIDVKPILEPRSIAVIGASDQPGNVGGDTVRRLRKFGFPGPVWPISRTAATVADLPCYVRVSELPEVPELVILAIPANALMDAISECADAGVSYGIAYAGGLAEAGGEGADLQRALTELCREGSSLCAVRIAWGSSTRPPRHRDVRHRALRDGLVAARRHFDGLPERRHRDDQLFDGAAGRFRFRYLVSSGNEAVVSFSDYLHAFAQDPGTRIIGGYLEGITDGPKLVRALEEARNQDKPVVLIKAGMTGATARAALAIRARWSERIACSTPFSTRWASSASTPSRRSSMPC